MNYGTLFFVLLIGYIIGIYFRMPAEKIGLV